MAAFSRSTRVLVRLEVSHVHPRTSSMMGDSRYHRFASTATHPRLRVVPVHSSTPHSVVAHIVAHWRHRLSSHQHRVTVVVMIVLVFEASVRRVVLRLY